MDIQKWLAETGSPTRAGRPDIEYFLLPKKEDSDFRAKRRRKRRRKRSSSDSSLLKAPSPEPPRKAIPASRQKSRAAQRPTVTPQIDASRHAQRESVGSSIASQRYLRKPRRKTRLDKYVVEPDRQKQKDKLEPPSRKNPSKKLRRKRERCKDEKTYNWVGQEFHAENVAKDRLTLKPLEKIGFFSKGKSSNSIKGRGLPDLVFSEMRFLRKEDADREPVTNAVDAKRERKKDKARMREDDISAFFTSARALKEIDGNMGLPKISAPTGIQRSRRAWDPSNQCDVAVAVAESDSRASHLSFSKKAPCYDGSSYVSWSESMHAPTTVPMRGSIPAQLHDNAVFDQHTAALQSRRHPPSRQLIPSSIRSVSAVHNANKVGTSSVPRVVVGLSRSRSLPQGSGPPHTTRSLDRNVGISTSAGVISSSPMPPQARIARDDPSLAVNELPPTESPHRSTSLGALLQDCRDLPQLKYEERPSVPARAHNAGFPLYERVAHVPRLLSTNAQPVDVSDLSGPSLHAQQGHGQRTKAQPYPMDIPIMHDAVVADQAAMWKSELVNQDMSYGDLSEGVAAYGMVDNEDAAAGGSELAEDSLEAIEEAEQTRVAGWGFWRPNRLY